MEKMAGNDVVQLVPIAVSVVFSGADMSRPMNFEESVADKT